MLRYTLIDYDGTKYTIEGFRPLCAERGIDDERNTIILIQIEDQWEQWETDRMFGSTNEQRREAMRCLLSFFADSHYTEPHLLIRWFTADIVPRVGHNPSYRADSDVWQR